MVKNAITLGQTTAFGKITGYTSPTQVTTNLNPTATASGLQVLWATDDTAAFQAAIADANAYALLHAIGEIFIPAAPAGLFYGIGGALTFTDGVNSIYNSQLTIPLNLATSVNSATNAGVTLVFRGAGDSGQTRFWNQQAPAISASTLISFGAFSSQAAQATTDPHSIANGGNPGVIGGPTGKFGYGVGTPTPAYTNTCVVLQDFTILTTHSNSGWTFSAANLFGCARAHLRNFSYGTTGVIELYNGNSGDFNNVTTFSGGASIGLLMPANGNNASNYVSNVVSNGGYTYAFLSNEHTVGNGLTILYSWSGLCPVGSYADAASSGAVSALHASYFDQVCIEACTYHINVFGAGAAGIGPIVNIRMDTEGTVQFRDNPNNGSGLSAARGEIHLYGSPSTPVIAVGTGTGATGGTGFRITKDVTLSGPATLTTSPALAINTAVQTTNWRPMTLTLSGGTVTNISISTLAGGTTPTMTSIYSQASGALPLMQVRLGPGQWLEIDGTVLPTVVSCVLD